MRLLDEGLMAQIAEFVTKYQAENGRSPGRRIVADKFNITVPRAHRHIHAAAGKGMLRLSDDGTIEIPYNLVPSSLNHVPLVGAVKCGEPTLAIEEFDGVFKLPREFTGTGSFFMLRAKGDSMEDANIFEGDYLVIREQETANSGDIVVACQNSEYGTEEDSDATLKRYLYRDGDYVLHAENSSGKYKDIEAGNFRIIGRLVSIIRKV